MVGSDVRSLIKKLESAGLLSKTDIPVSPHLEITEIHRRVISQNGSALLFTNVCNHDGKKYAFNLLTNIFGSEDRIALALNRESQELEKLGEDLAFLFQPRPPSSLSEAFKMLPLAKHLLSFAPKTVNKAPCHELVLKGDEIDLNIFPIQTCWAEDAGKLITWPLVITKSFDNDDIFNLGVYRMQVIAKNKTIMRWLKHRGGARHFDLWKEKNGNKPMPIAVTIGADPAIMLAAAVPVPDNISEYAFAGILKGKAVELVDCITVPLKVPASSEIVLEGFIATDEVADEGPFGDHTGYYNEKEQFPVFTISAITMRKNAIYVSTYTGRPPDEPSVIGETMTKLFIPIIKKQFPEIVDFHLPPETCSYRTAIIAIKKSFAGQAKRVMMGLWSFLKQFLYTKIIIIVDGDINIRDWKDVMWAVSTRMDPSRDITIIDNTPIDYLDFSSPFSGLGGKLGIDATIKKAPETKRNYGKILKSDPETEQKVNEKWTSFNFEKQN